MELWKKKYRPKNLESLVGQDKVKQILNGCIKKNKFPSTFLLSGYTGVGKTTIARILRRLVGCSKVGYEELNAASERGIDTIREIESQAGINPLEGSVKMWVLDEAHALSKDAMGALLKITEDPPPDTYIILCTTNPEKLLPALVGRCKHLKLEPLEEEELKVVLKRVCKGEGVEISKKVIGRIIDCANGSARNAINLLESVLDIEDEKEQLACIVSGDPEVVAKEIVTELCKQKSHWPTLAKLIRQVKEDPERMRRMVLGYAEAMILNGVQSPKLDYILISFEPDLFASGRPGFTSRCREVCNRR